MSGRFLYFHVGADDAAALAGTVGAFQVAAGIDCRSGRKIGALDDLHQFIDRGVAVFHDLVVDDLDQGIDDLSQVVGRDGGRHTDGDAAGSVDQQVGEAGRKDQGLL